VGVLLTNGDLVVPPFTRIITSTTTQKVLNFIENVVLKNPAVYSIEFGKQGYLNRVVRREILVDEAKLSAAEVFFMGGDVLVPILEWDGHVISEYKGPLASAL